MIGLNALYSYVFDFERATDVSHIPEQYRAAHLAKREAQIKQAFEQISPDRRLAFRQFCRDQKHDKLETLLFGNTTDEIDMDPDEYEDYEYYCVLPSDPDIEEKFERKTFPYPFFKKDDAAAKAMFVKFYKAGFLQAGFFERSDFNSYEAYQMLALFYRPDRPKLNPFTWIERYIKMSNAISDPQPLRTALLFELPKTIREDKPVDLAYWQNLVLNKTSMICLFAYADILTEEVKQGAPLETLKEKAIAKTYARHAENPALAKLCWQYVVPEKEFDKCLEVDKKAKTDDLMPDITVDMHSTNGKHHYVLTKLPARDPRGYVIGEMTDCCQHIGGYGEQCTIDGMQLPTSGFYVLLKGPKNGAMHGNPLENPNYRVVAQAYAWVSQNNALVLDSWESLAGEDTRLAATILQRFGEAAIEQHPDLAAVLVGTGGGTPKELKTNDRYSEKMQAGVHYSDSLRQYAINTTPQKKLQRTFEEKVNAFLKGFGFNGHFYADAAFADGSSVSLKMLSNFERLTSEEFSISWENLDVNAKNILEGYYDVFAKHAAIFIKLLTLLESDNDLEHQEIFDNLVYIFPKLVILVDQRFFNIPPERQAIFARVFHDIGCQTGDAEDNTFYKRLDMLFFLLQEENFPHEKISSMMVDSFCVFEPGKHKILARLFGLLHPDLIEEAKDAMLNLIALEKKELTWLTRLSKSLSKLKDNNKLTPDTYQLLLAPENTEKMSDITSLLEDGIPVQAVPSITASHQLLFATKSALEKLKKLDLLEPSIINRMCASHINVITIDIITQMIKEEENKEHKDILKGLLPTVTLGNLAFAFLLLFTKVKNQYGIETLSILAKTDGIKNIEKQYKESLLAFLQLDPQQYNATINQFIQDGYLTQKQAQQIRIALSIKEQDLLLFFALKGRPVDAPEEDPAVMCECALDVIEFVSYMAKYQAVHDDLMATFLLRINHVEKIKRCVDVARLLVKHDQFNHDTALALASNTQDYDQVERALKLLLENHAELVTTNRLLQLLKNPDIADVSLSLMLGQRVSHAGMFAHDDGLARSQELVVERNEVRMDLRKSV